LGSKRPRRGGPGRGSLPPTAAQVSAEPCQGSHGARRVGSYTGAQLGAGAGLASPRTAPARHGNVPDEISTLAASAASGAPVGCPTKTWDLSQILSDRAASRTVWSDTTRSWREVESYYVVNIEIGICNINPRGCGASYFQLTQNRSGNCFYRCRRTINSAHPAVARRTNSTTWGVPPLSDGASNSTSLMQVGTESVKDKRRAGAQLRVPGVTLLKAGTEIDSEPFESDKPLVSAVGRMGPSTLRKSL